MTGLDRTKYAAKWAVAHLLYALGILHLWKRVALRRRAVVLTYHRVLPQDRLRSTWSHPAIVVSRETFDRHVRVLSRGFRILTLDEFDARLAGRQPFDTASCLITFDDGWGDNYTDAWPILKRYGVPATIFLSVNFIGSSEVFWQERFGALLYETWCLARTDRGLATQAENVLRPLGLAHVLLYAPEVARQAIQDEVRGRKRQHARIANGAIESLVPLLNGNSPAPPGESVDSFMSWAQVREMAADGVTFGGHGATHRILTDLEPSEVASEVAISRSKVGSELPGSGAFSYPNGDWSPEVAEAVKRGGFRLAFSMKRGVVKAGDDPLAVRRINIFEDVTSSTPMFLARVLGVF